MTFQQQYNKWKENTLKKSLEKFKERKERFETDMKIGKNVPKGSWKDENPVRQPSERYFHPSG